jgi:hypothetical protein
MSRVLSFTSVIAVVLGIGATSSAQVKLEHKYPDGAKSTTVMQVKTKQVLTLAGMDIETGADQTFTITSVNGQRAADGTLQVVHKFDALTAKVSLPGGVELEFDSSKPNADPPGTQFDIVLDIYKVLAKSSWTATHDKSNRVISVEGRDKALESLDEALRAATKKQFEPEYLKQQANDELNKIPSKPVSKGDTWDLTTVVRLDSGQKLTFTTQYQYQGTAEHGGKQLDQIKSTTKEVTYSVDADAPLKVTKSDLKVTSSDGLILFDREAGQVIESRNTMQIKGDLTLEVLGNEYPGKLDLTLEHLSKPK